MPYTTAGFPTSVALGDLDHDTNPDMVVSCGNNTVSVLMGSSTGTFTQLLPNYGTPANATSVAVGDLDGDGDLDMVATSFSSIISSVSVRLGNGDGTFGPRADYGPVGGLTSVAIGYLNGDGNLDVAVTRGSNKVHVLLGDGNGGLLPETSYDAGNDPRCVAIGHLNDDGLLDLAVANSASGTVSVLLKNGTGGFGPKTDYVTGGNPRSVAIGDLNHDGYPDLAVANSGLVAVSVLLGQANGSFVLDDSYPTWCCPGSVAIGDLNGDGHPDLASANTSQPTYLVSVLLGLGNGKFAPREDYVTGAAPYFVAIGDLNHDDKLDLAVADNNASSVSVLLNIAPTTAAPPDVPPARFALMLAGPNPAHRAVRLDAALPRAASVDVAIYSLQGGLVRRLLAGASLPAGMHPLAWDACDESGARAPSGVYFARMRTDGIVSGRTTIVLQ